LVQRVGQQLCSALITTAPYKEGLESPKLKDKLLIRVNRRRSAVGLVFASYPQEISMAEFKSDPQHPETGRTTQPQGGDNYTFKCSDVGFKSCNWATRGSSPEEVLRNAEQHGREAHNLTSIDDKTRDMVRSNIHRAA
jgi:predicted small metal-binding protein